MNVPEHEKVSALRSLLANDAIEDIHVELANLEQVYQHYLKQAHEINQVVDAKQEQQA